MRAVDAGRVSRRTSESAWTAVLTNGRRSSAHSGADNYLLYQSFGLPRAASRGGLPVDLDAAAEGLEPEGRRRRRRRARPAATAGWSVCSVSGISEFRRPLNELKVTVPRALSGTRRSTLPLKVSTSMVWLGSHDFSRMRHRAAERLRPDRAGDVGQHQAATKSRARRAGRRRPSTVTGELKTDRSSWVRRGTLMSKSVSTTLLPRRSPTRNGRAGWRRRRRCSSRWCGCRA